MKIYKLSCINPDGDYEENGYYFSRKSAEKNKKIVDQYRENLNYGIEQDIDEIEVSK